MDPLARLKSKQRSTPSSQPSHCWAPTNCDLLIPSPNTLSVANGNQRYQWAWKTRTMAPQDVWRPSSGLEPPRAVASPLPICSTENGTEEMAYRQRRHSLQRNREISSCRGVMKPNPFKDKGFLAQATTLKKTNAKIDLHRVPMSTTTLSSLGAPPENAIPRD